MHEQVLLNIIKRLPALNGYARFEPMHDRVHFIFENYTGQLLTVAVSCEQLRHAPLTLIDNICSFLASSDLLKEYEPKYEDSSMYAYEGIWPPPKPGSAHVAPANTGGAAVRDKLSKLLDLEQRSKCPDCTYSFKLYRLVVHLNDTHKWTRERIADWLEESDLDITLRPGR